MLLITAIVRCLSPIEAETATKIKSFRAINGVNRSSKDGSIRKVEISTGRSSDPNCFIISSTTVLHFDWKLRNRDSKIRSRTIMEKGNLDYDLVATFRFLPLYATHHSLCTYTRWISVHRLWSYIGFVRSLDRFSHRVASSIGMQRVARSTRFLLLDKCQSLNFIGLCLYLSLLLNCFVVPALFPTCSIFLNFN